ncbi:MULTISPECIES: NADP-dependent oxidoreductase [unclassified Streptomyces]|uniref:MDR family NADP-dependent oxidoreductase n=1 Tax=unclassified Streptomyces TaxID=2593676 RepID=UPI00225374E7|nr:MULTISPECIES: NADP-dependent oxidoreductase [unclassified Streptomyces]MCX5440592.1 NADP-dependent oxidoreductase [Streptomyces sp. NBC_00063]WSE18077.1 NADP-dependent oxidoreductase [Streptomyces sp. NBC_01397]WUB93030.1 NADP-dependent oxidoreductase [Streptomyces sp. NBC_00569]
MTAQTLPATGKEVRLARYVVNQPAKDDFEVVEVDVAEPTSGNVLVRNLYLQVTAVMRDLMTEDPGLPMMPAYKVGERPWGGAVGVVVASQSPDLAVGDTVQHMDGWTEYSTGPAGQYFKVDPSWYPGPEYFLNQGITAYHGMADVAEVGEDDVVFVSNAAGGVGSLAGQIAKARGAKRVIGSAGSAEKVEYLTKELGYDAAFNYKDGPVVDQLRELAPDGINVFFDLVGGEQFEAAVQASAQGARLVLGGAVSAQTGNAEGAFPKLDIMAGIIRQIVIKPFSTYHTPEQIQAWNQHFAQWLQEGKIVLPYTVVEGGVDAAPEALTALLGGAYKGNVLVKIS